jgi:hypothetical protein
MALNVTGNFEQPTGQVLTAAYARTNAALSLQGDQVMAYPEFWVDEAAFTAGKDNLRVDMRADFSYAYDRATDGADILAFANAKVKETLEGLGYTATIVELD